MNAIILAAGKGSRLLPLTLQVPKPLIKVKDVRIIEQQIIFLKEAGVEDIYVVVGYLSDQFDYLKVKYDIKLIFNPEYNSFNNLYSLYVSKSFFGNTWVIEGDVFMTRNFFLSDISRSTYFTGLKGDVQNEWILEFDAKHRLQNILVPGDGNFPEENIKTAYIMSGVSYWTTKNAEVIIGALEETICQSKDSQSLARVKEYYWDQIVKENLHKLDISIQIINPDDWYEIDTLNDLGLIV